MANAVIDGLTPEQEQAVVALLNEHSISKAAKACGIAERTVYNWLDNPEFMRRYRKARRDAFSQAIALTQRYAPVAVNALAKIMTDPQSPPAAKVSAAANLLKFGRESIELDDLAARVEQLEATLKEQEKK